jgi:hypothetical protein
MFVSASKSTVWISFSEPWMLFKNLLCTIRLQQYLCILNRVPFRNINLEVNMTSCKIKLTEFKSKSFKLTKPFSTSIDMGLFPKAVVSTFGVKFHCDPVVSCVNRWLFIESITYIFHRIFFSCRTFIGHTLSGVPCATKKDCLSV